MSLIVCALALSQGASPKARWKLYDFGCMGLQIELPVELKRVDKTLKPKDRVITTTNYQAAFGDVWINVFLKAKPTKETLAVAPKVLASNEGLARYLTGLSDPQIQRYRETKRGFDNRLSILAAKTNPKSSPLGFAYLGTRPEVLVLIALATKKPSDSNVSTMLRIVNSTSWKPASSKKQ